MEPDRNILRLKHITESIRRIEFIVNNLSYGAYLEDWIKQDAITRNIEIIGEASKQINQEFKEKYADVDWKGATAMRNFIIHEYFDVNYDEVWKTLKQDIPVLKMQIQQILKDIEKI